MNQTRYGNLPNLHANYKMVGYLLTDTYDKKQSQFTSSRDKSIAGWRPKKKVLTFEGCVGSDQDAQQRVLVHGCSDATLEGLHGVIALNEEGFPRRIGLSVAQQAVRLNLLAQDNLVVTYLGQTEMEGREKQR